MRKRRTIVLTAVLTVLIVCMNTAFASAASLSEIRDQIKDKEAELKEGKSKESSLSTQMLELDKKIQNMQNSIDQLDSAIAEGEEKLKTLEADLKEAEKKVEGQNDNLGDRLRTMYKNGSVGFLDVLMDSTSFSEFLTNLDMVERVYASDKEVLGELETAYDEIDTKKKEVETLQAELSESKTVAEQSKSELETSKATVEQQKSEISASNEETQEMLDKLNADADAMAQNAVENGSSSSESTYTGGTMAWPVPSVGTNNITSVFGWRTHPIFGVGRGHKGVDIGASYGASVVAANPGKVIYAGWSGGYGNCVQIDHGGGVVTLYAHNSRIKVRKGQQVSRGQTIALIGSTGYSTGPHCHIEVILNGTHVDPLDYIL